MTADLLSTTTAARLARARQQRMQGRTALACLHDELSDAVRHLGALAVRLEDAGADPFSRTLAAAILARFDALLPESLAQEARTLIPALERQAEPGPRQAAARLRVDHAWLATNWHELQPMIAGIADGQSWVDGDALRDAAELFCNLAHDHLALVAAAAAGQEAGPAQSPVAH